MDKQQKKTSKFLSLLLRHKPETIGLSLDVNGWANIDDLIRLTKDQAQPLMRENIEFAVANNDKQRFIFSDDGKSIRANQGHSIDVELDLEEKQPPEFLYHGTATRFIDSIKTSGLEKQQRQHVHLSDNLETASKVGIRHGKLVILKVLAGEMHKQGYCFYLSTNKVWLTVNVPPIFLVEYQ